VRFTIGLAPNLLAGSVHGIAAPEGELSPALPVTAEISSHPPDLSPFYYYF
jgi:hypothetical protein